MTTQHTPGRLKVVNDTGEWAAEYDAEGTTCSVGLVTESGSMVALAVAYSPNIFADPDPTANARRLMAAWNACEGIGTDTLVELGPETTLVKIAIKALEKVDQALMRNAELLAALKLLVASEPLISEASDADLESALDDEDATTRIQARN